MGKNMFLLYLKALIWSVFVSYSPSTVNAIAHCLREGRILDDYPEFQDSHLGEGLRYILKELPDAESRAVLADALSQVKDGAASTIYQNMVLEVGHYVTANDCLTDLPEGCHGVVFRIDGQIIDVLFRLPGQGMISKRVHSFEVMPVYTLTVSDDDA